jgi:hypothetical protein
MISTYQTRAGTGDASSIPSHVGMVSRLETATMKWELLAGGEMFDVPLFGFQKILVCIKDVLQDLVGRCAVPAKNI